MSATTERPSDSRNCVLVAGDARTARWADAVAAQGFQVFPAGDGAQARRALTEQRPGVVVVVDALSGEPSGLSLLRWARGAVAHLQGILVTDDARPGAAVEAYRAGAFDVVVTPADPGVLVEKVKRAAECHATAVARAHVQRKYEALFETVPGVVFFLDGEGRVRRINREGARLLGYDAEELEGGPAERILAEPDGEGRWVFRERRSSGCPAARRTVELATRDGRRRFYDLQASGVWDGGAPGTPVRCVGTLGAGWDITDQLATGEQLRQAQKMDALGRVVGGVAHDFNNLLTVINTNARLLRADLHAEPRLLDMVRDVEEAGRRAAQLTRQLLTFSRKDPLQTAALDLNELLAGVEPMLSRLLGERVTIRVDVCAERLPLLADQGQLEQVLLNLALNARDAMPAGGTLTFRTRVNPAGPEDLCAHARLSVTDTGTGMDPGVREHLFEPFFTTKPPERGSGLGLAVVYGILQRHDATVYVETAPGAGTSFHVDFPLREAAAEAPQPREVTRTLVRGNETVLVVEDDAAVRKLLHRLLEHQGYVALDAPDGQQALDLLARRPEVDLVITDIVMPTMDGPTLLLEVRRRAPRAALLAVTGYTDGDAVSRLRDQDVHTLTKPLLAGPFLRSVRQAIDARGGQVAVERLGHLC
ncbi:MAG: response regulator [Deltaproteobacteria bacterium]|nr:response regulator [Deltaproteobacteria bacterium]